MIDPLGARASSSVPLPHRAGQRPAEVRGAAASSQGEGSEAMGVSPEELRQRLARAREVTQAVLELLRATREEAGGTLERTRLALQSAAGAALPAAGGPRQQVSGMSARAEEPGETRRARRKHAARLRELLGTPREPLLSGRVKSLGELPDSVVSALREVRHEGHALGPAQGAVRPLEAQRLLAPLAPLRSPAPPDRR